MATARKLSAVVWWILSYRQPYREPDEALTARNEINLERIAAVPAPVVGPPELQAVGEELAEKASILSRLAPTIPRFEEERGGNG